MCEVIYNNNWGIRVIMFQLYYLSSCCMVCVFCLKGNSKEKRYIFVTASVCPSHSCPVVSLQCSLSSLSAAWLNVWLPVYPSVVCLNPTSSLLVSSLSPSTCEFVVFSFGFLVSCFVHCVLPTFLIPPC